MNRNLFLAFLGLLVVALVQQLVVTKMNSVNKVYYGRTYNVAHNCSVSDSAKDAKVDSTQRNVVFIGDVDSAVLENPRVRTEEFDIDPLIFSRSMHYVEFEPEDVRILAEEVNVEVEVFAEFTDSLRVAQGDTALAVKE